MKKDNQTAEKILKAAFKEFETKGFYGARMQSIADQAGINKALLHYYFKSKDQLFEVVLENALKLIIPKVVASFVPNQNIFDSIKTFVAVYIDMIIKHPHIPGFLMYELNHNPQRLLKFAQKTSINLNLVKKRFNEEIKKGTIKNFPPEHLIVNIIGLCVFPFVSKPMIKGLVLNGDDAMFYNFVSDRKKLVADFVINAIKNTDS
jgi:AcrR family transcriptional regulator